MYSVDGRAVKLEPRISFWSDETYQSLYAYRIPVYD